MIKSCPSRRTFVACPKVLLVLVCVLAIGLSVSGSPLPQGASQGPHIYIDDGRSLLSNYVGPKDVVQALTSAGRPLSLAAADFNEDTVTAAANSSSVALSGATLAAGALCKVAVNVTGTASGVLTNSVQANSIEGLTGNTASANLNVASPPSIVKTFGAAAIPLNSTTSLTFNITSPNTVATLTGIAFTDTLPAGLAVATSNGLSSTCGGTPTAVAGSGAVSLIGGTLAPGANCTVSVNVTGTAAGVKNNSVQVTSIEGGTGNTSTANLTVIAPPVLSKSFGAASIPLSGSTSLSFTVQNNNGTVALNGVGFSDSLPPGLVISTPNGLSGACGGGSITATAGTGAISLSGATLAASASCTFSVNVTGTTAGAKNNLTGAVTSTESGTGGTASASIAVVAPPLIAKAFNPTTVVLNGITALTLTVTNPAANSVAQAGVAFIDSLPAGLVVATPNALTNSCGGTATATAGSGSITLTGGTTNTSCTVVVNVQGTASGPYTNTTGNVSSTNGGTGLTASANLTVASPPTITKAFGAATIPLNSSTSLTFNITNPNPGVAFTGLAFTDSLPAGLAVATPNGLSSTCGGTVTAVAGSGLVSLAGGTEAVSASCTVSVNVTGTAAGLQNNSVQVTSVEGGTGNTSSASVTVVSPPTISNLFGAASIPLNGATSLSFTIHNTNALTTLTGIGFSNTLPAGLAISIPNGLTGSCGGGTITATAGSSSLSLTGATLAAGGSCTFSANVTGIHAGTQIDTTGTVTSTNGGTGLTASASVTVNQGTTQTSMVSGGSIHFGQAATFTATVSSTAGTPTGNVTFLDGVTSLGTAALSSGVATLSNNSLALGTHSITAQYLGNSDYVGSTSTATSQDVTAPAITINTGGSSSTPLTATVTAGGSGTLQFTLDSAGTLTTPITFSCLGLPTGAQCIFSPDQVDPASLPVTVTVTITTTRLEILGHRGPYNSPWTLAVVLPAVCLLPFAGRRGKRRWLLGVLGLALLLALVLGVGCGGSPNTPITNVQQSTSPGTYPVTIVAHSAGAVQGSITFNITVTH